MRLSPRLTVLLLTPSVLWALNAVLGRMAVGSIDSLWLNVFRWMVAFVLLLPFGWRALATTEARAQIALRWRHLAGLGLLGVGAYNGLQYTALRTSTPLNVTLIASSSPVWAMAIGALFYRVIPRRVQQIGAVLSLAGVAVVLSRGDMSALARIEFVQGDLLMLLAMLGWSVYGWMLARPPAYMRGAQRPSWNWAEFLVAQCIFGLVFAAAAAAAGNAVAPSAPTHWSWPLVFTILYMGIGPSIIAYRAFGIAVAEAGPSLAAIFYNLTPLFTALLSAAMVGEWPKPYHGVAFLLIVAGIAVSSWTGSKPPR